MGYRLPNAARFYSDVGVNVLMMDYRGYGAFTMRFAFPSLGTYVYASSYHCCCRREHGYSH